MATHFVFQLNGMLRYYMGIKEPEKLPIKIWALRVAELEHVRNEERGKSENFLDKMLKAVKKK